MKIINSKVHGILDYAVVALFVLGPVGLGLKGVPAYLSFALAGVHFLVTVLTNMPFGVVKVIPMKVHGLIELVVAPTLVAIPWVFGFNTDTNAMAFFSCFGGIVFIAWLLTDYSNTNNNNQSKMGTVTPIGTTGTGTGNTTGSKSSGGTSRAA
jgi:hypothetical protein